MFMTFAKVALVAAFMLYVPGYLLFRGIGLARWQAVAAAPAACLAGFEALAIAYYYLGVRCSLASLLSPTLAVCAAVWVLGFVRARRSGGAAKVAADAQAGELASGTDRAILLTEAACGACMSALLLFVFYRNGRYDMVQGGYDMTYHLNILRSMSETGVYSMLKISPYALGSPLYETPFLWNPGSFYPAAWHAIVASVMGLTSAPISLVINGVVFVFAGVVYGSGMGALLHVLLADRIAKPRAPKLLLAIGLLAAFPWATILLGNYPLVTASFATLPLLVLAWLLVLERFVGRRGRLAAAFTLLVALFAIVCVHTSVLFAAAQLIVFVTVAWLLQAGREGRLPERTARRAALGFVAFSLVAWVALAYAPFMRRVVWYTYWQATKSWPRAVADALLMKNVTIPQAQPVLAFLVLAGFVRAVREPSARWVAALRAFAVLMIAAAWADEGLVNHLISGFWYVDPDRSCVVGGIFTLPCLALGADTLAMAAARFVQSLSHCRSAADSAASKAPATQPSTSAPAAPVAQAVALLLAAALVLVPSFTLPGIGQYHATAFGYVRTATRAQIDPNYQAALRVDEIAFGQRALEITGTRDLVLNIPDDGSTTFYGLLGINTYYRRNYMDHYAEADLARLLRYRATPAHAPLAYGLYSLALRADGAQASGPEALRASIAVVQAPESALPYPRRYARRDPATSWESHASELLRLGLSRYTQDADVAAALELSHAKYLLQLDVGPESDRGYFHTHKDFEWAGMLGVTADTPGFTEVLAEGDMHLYRIDANW